MERLAPSLLIAFAPLAFIVCVAVANAIGANPRMKPEEFERLVKAIKESEWARSLASRMATTPEAQEIVAERLARGLAESIARMM
jgi:hypothetical protein